MPLYAHIRYFEILQTWVEGEGAFPAKRNRNGPFKMKGGLASHVERLESTTGLSGAPGEIWPSLRIIRIDWDALRF